MTALLTFARVAERPPISRYPWGSPCRWVRTVDLTVHLVIPYLLAQRFPRIARRLREASPRWGRLSCSPAQLVEPGLSTGRAFG